MGTAVTLSARVGDPRGRPATRGFADLMAAFRFDARRLTRYETEWRVARALFDVLAGLDPGAVRLAQTLLALIPTRRPRSGRSARVARGIASAVSLSSADTLPAPRGVGAGHYGDATPATAPSQRSAPMAGALAPAR